MGEIMAIDKEFIVQLKGKSYPLWAGVLDAATKAGLKALTTTIVQIPTAENGHLAVVTARAEFEDGRVFEDVGDCSPGSTSPQLAAAALRLASTRAKGRALRDSINVGQTMFEELPDGEVESGENGARTTHSDRTAVPRARHDPQDQAAKTACAVCGAAVPAAVANAAIKEFSEVLCIPHARERRARRAETEIATV
jgi:hypothetical protein